MPFIRRTLARLATLLRGHGRADAELRAEMEAHLAIATDENIRRGLHPDEARRQAILASGGLTQAAEGVRDQRTLPWMENLAADLRYAVRHFRRTPLSTVTMVLILALGIGVNIVVFTVFNSLATMPAPGLERDGAVVRIRGTMAIPGVSAPQARLFSWPEVQALAARSELFSGVAAHASETATLTEGDLTTTVSLIYTTPNHFGLLGVRPTLGTIPAADPDISRLSTSPAALISHALWQQRFGGAPDAIGRVLRVNDVQVQIAGVAPPRFVGTEGGDAMTMWVPLAAYPLLAKRSPAVFASRDSAFLDVAARLREGVTMADATPVVAGVAAQATGAADSLIAGADVVPMLAGNARVGGDPMDALVSGAAALGVALLALLITCTNVSALMVGLAVARRREIGVRLSLGAPRSRLIRQLLTESVLLALVAASLGLLVTTLGIRVVEASLQDVQLVVDWRVTLGTSAVAVVTGILFGLSPALLATRVSIGEVLKSTASSVAATRSRLQRALVVAQVALTQPLLVGLGVVIVTMGNDAGRRITAAPADRIAELELDTWAGRVTGEERRARITALVERVAAMPGVVAALPMQMGIVNVPLRVHPADRVPGIVYEPPMSALLTAAPDGYFGAFEIPIVRGRGFDAADHARGVADTAVVPAHEAVVIGSDLARRLWGAADPVGRRLEMAVASRAGNPPMVVVGVVDAAAAGPSVVNDQVRVYVPYSTLNTGVIARTTGPALPMLAPLRRVAAETAPQLPVTRAETMQHREATARRTLMQTTGAVAGGGLLALFLSAIGLYAVVSLAVSQRTREIGIRTALGAQRGAVVRMFFARGLALSALGLALGLPLSILATRFIAGVVRWPLAGSPLIGVAIGAVVLVVASIATWIPARRASTIDPVIALRTE